MTKGIRKTDRKFNASFVRVTTTLIKAGTIQHDISGTASVESKKDIPIFVKEGLYVKSLNVTMGDHVEKGDVLFEVDLDKLEETIKEAETELEIFKLQLEEIQNNNSNEKEKIQLSKEQAEETYQQIVDEQDKAVKKAKQTLDQAENNYNDYINKLKDESDQVEEMEQTEETESIGETSQTSDTAEQQLLDAIAVAEEAYDNAVSQRDSAVLSAKQELDPVKTEGVENTSEQQQKLLCEKTENNLDTLEQIKNSNGEIRSDVSGTIVDVSILSGDITSVNSVMLISDSDSGVQLKASFPLEYNNEIEAGQTLVLQNHNVNDTENEFEIEKIYVDNEKNEIVILAFLPKNIQYRIGESFTVKITTPKIEYPYIVPLEALNQNENGKYYVNTIVDTETILGTEKTVLPVEVALLDKDMNSAAVEGIYEGQEIILDSTRVINKGSRVKYNEEISD